MSAFGNGRAPVNAAVTAADLTAAAGAKPSADLPAAGALLVIACVAQFMVVLDVSS